MDHVELFKLHWLWSVTQYSLPQLPLQCMVSICTPWLSETWSTGVGMFINIKKIYVICNTHHNSTKGVGCCVICHCCLYKALILAQVSTILLSRTWFTCIGMFILPLLPTLKRHWYVTYNIYHNFPKGVGCYMVCHCQSYKALILKHICTILLSRTWFTCVRMSICLLLPTLKPPLIHSLQYVQ